MNLYVAYIQVEILGAVCTGWTDVQFRIDGCWEDAADVIATLVPWLHHAKMQNILIKFISL